MVAKKKLTNPTPVQLPSGSWRCQVMVKGKRISVVDDDPEVAHTKALALKTGLMKENKDKAGKKLTVNDAILAYMEAGDGVLSPSTLRGYDCIRRFRFKSLMKEDVYSLTRLQVQKAVSQEAKTVSPKTVSNAWGLLSAVLKDYNVEVNGIKLPQKIKQKKEYLSSAEIVKLIDAAVGDLCEVPIVMAVWLGLRRSEIAGLCWDCVDFEHSTITVKRTLVLGPDREWVLKEGAKNEGSQRTVKCPEYIMSKLREMYHGQDGRLFSQCPEAFRKHVQIVCKRAGIRNTTLHGLRHANAAVMIALGVVDKYAMARNGWTSDYTFKQIYGYVFPEEADRTDDIINTYFEKQLGLHTEIAHDKE